MAAPELNLNNAEGYWRLIKDTTNDVKLRLISLLSDSIARDIEKRKTESEKEATEEFIKCNVGTWLGNESAEEIIDKIYSSRITSDRPNPFDL